MNHLVSELQEVRTRHSARALAVLALGPLTMLGGVAWAFLQPYRLTILHPHGEGFWWLFVQPPLLVVAVGVFFSFLAYGIVRDLEESEE